MNSVEFVEKTGYCVKHGDVTGFIIIDKDRYYCYKCFEEKVLIPNCERVIFDD